MQEAYRPQEGVRCWPPPADWPPAGPDPPPSAHWPDTPPGWTWPPRAGWTWPSPPSAHWPDPPPPSAHWPDRPLAGPDPPGWTWHPPPPSAHWPDPPPAGPDPPPGVDRQTKWNYYLPVVLRTRAVTSRILQTLTNRCGVTCHIKLLRQHTKQRFAHILCGVLISSSATGRCRKTQTLLIHLWRNGHLWN